MRVLKLLIVFVMIFSNSIAQSSDAVVGKWLNKDKDAHIHIFKKGDKFFGKIVWLKNPNDDSGKPRVDKNNPTLSLKERSILGLEILNDFMFKNGIWEGGSIYDPKSGKLYSCKLSLNGNNKLNVRGYVGVSLLGRTDVWTRVN